jgi:cobalt/nickel transport system permease protein
MRRLRIPGIFITMFEMTYRYIGVLLIQAYSMSIAYSLRCANKRGIEIKDMGSFAGQLLLRSFDRADRVYNAMKCRGYALQNISRNSGKLALSDVVFFAGVSLLCVTFRIVDVNSLSVRVMERFF